MDENDFITKNWIAAVRVLASTEQSINWELTIQLARLLDAAILDHDHDRLIEINNLLADSVDMLIKEQIKK